MTVPAPDARKSEWNGTLADAIERLRRLETFLRECCRSGAAARVLMHMDDAAAIACVLDAITDPHARVSAHPKSPSEPPPERPAALTPCDAGVSSPLHASQGAISEGRA